MKSIIIDQLIEQLKALPYDQQRRVLEFARALVLSTPRGVAGADLLRFAGTIPQEDVRRIQEAIEQGCEHVNKDEW